MPSSTPILAFSGMKTPHGLFSPRAPPITAEVIPIDVLNTNVLFQPRHLSGIRARSVLEHIRDISGQFGTEIDIKGDRGTILIEK
jgi:hypothetical protein